MQVFWTYWRGLGEQPVPKPGTFVQNGKNPNLIGFVSEVDAVNERVLIYLFKAEEAAADVEIVHSAVTDVVVHDRLTAILRQDAEMRERWNTVITQAQMRN